MRGQRDASSSPWASCAAVPGQLQSSPKVGASSPGPRVAWRGVATVRSLPVFVSAVAAQQFSFPLIAAAAEALPELPAQRLPGSGVEPQPVQGWPLRCAAAGAQPEQQAGCFPLSADEAK